MSLQRVKRFIKQKFYERLAAPINNVIYQLEKEITLLVEQKGLMESWGRFEDRFRVAFLRYAESLESLDDEGMQRLVQLLNVRLVAWNVGALVTGVVDPSLFTIAQTLASSSAGKYFFRVVELEEIAISRHPLVVQWSPC